MNERIKQLAEQARAEVRADWAKGNKIPYPEAHYAFQRDNDQKFAELIVKECMNQVREQYLPVLEDEIMMKDTYWDGYVLCGVDSYVAIKEHFGVEE